MLIGLPVLGMVEVIAKSDASVPLIGRPFSFSEAAPLLVITAVRMVPLVAPTGVEGKLLAPDQATLATG